MGPVVQIPPGTVFGRWTVIGPATSYATISDGKRARFLCRCVCGKERPVCTRSLRTGKSKSCGCLQGDIIRGTFRRQMRSHSEGPASCVPEEFDE